MNYPFDEFPEKESDWREAHHAVCMAIAEFRNILDETRKLTAEQIINCSQSISYIQSFSEHGIKELGGEL